MQTITVNNLIVCVNTTDDGIVVDIYPNDGKMENSIASCYAFFCEVDNA